MGSLRDPVTTEPAKGEIADALLKNREINTAITRQPQMFASYISGYVDSEGCFTVSVNQRSKMTTGKESIRLGRYSLVLLVMAEGLKFRPARMA